MGADLVVHGAKRFVETAIKLYGHERTFDLSFGDLAELQSAAAEFELLGWRVSEDRHHLRLIVSSDALKNEAAPIG